jgi:hypothetical protein
VASLQVRIQVGQLGGGHRSWICSKSIKRSKRSARIIEKMIR